MLQSLHMLLLHLLLFSHGLLEFLLIQTLLLLVYDFQQRLMPLYP